jgi:hypothetical protein
MTAQKFYNSTPLEPNRTILSTTYWATASKRVLSFESAKKNHNLINFDNGYKNF